MFHTPQVVANQIICITFLLLLIATTLQKAINGSITRLRSTGSLEKEYIQGTKSLENI